MNKLNRFHKYIILNSVECAGTYDPQELMFRFEEAITEVEYNTISSFLSYIHDNKLAFGGGNIDSRFEEFKKA